VDGVPVVVVGLTGEEEKVKKGVRVRKVIDKIAPIMINIKNATWEWSKVASPPKCVYLSPLFFFIGLFIIPISRNEILFNNKLMTTMLLK